MNNHIHSKEDLSSFTKNNTEIPTSSKDPVILPKQNMFSRLYFYWSDMINTKMINKAKQRTEIGNFEPKDFQFMNSKSLSLDSNFKFPHLDNYQQSQQTRRVSGKNNPMQSSYLGSSDYNSQVNPTEYVNNFNNLIGTKRRRFITIGQINRFKVWDRNRNSNSNCLNLKDEENRNNCNQFYNGFCRSGNETQNIVYKIEANKITKKWIEDHVLNSKDRRNINNTLNDNHIQNQTNSSSQSDSIRNSNKNQSHRDSLNNNSAEDETETLIDNNQNKKNKTNEDDKVKELFYNSLNNNNNNNSTNIISNNSNTIPIIKSPQTWKSKIKLIFEDDTKNKINFDYLIDSFTSPDISDPSYSFNSLPLIERYIKASSSPENDTSKICFGDNPLEKFKEWLIWLEQEQEKEPNEKSNEFCDDIVSTLNSISSTMSTFPILMFPTGNDRNYKSITIGTKTNKKKNNNININGIFSSNSNVNPIQSEEKIFFCDFCSETFSSGQGLGGHMSRKHKDQSLKFKHKKEIRNKREPLREVIWNAKKILCTNHWIDYDEQVKTIPGKKLIKKMIIDFNEEYKKIRSELKKKSEMRVVLESVPNMWIILKAHWGWVEFEEIKVYTIIIMFPKME